MTKKRIGVGIVAVIVFFCSLIGLTSCLPDSETEAEPTAVVAEAVESSDEITQGDNTEEEVIAEESTEEAEAHTPEPSPTSTVEVEEATVIDASGNEIVGETATVTQIIDGDTIDVEIEGEIYRVRYIGMDTPERDEPLFQEAAEANVRLVANQEVILVKDVSETDAYDRLLRYVYLPDGTFVNGELVRLGFAEAVEYPPDTAMKDTLAELEQTAVNASIGLWKEPVVAEVPTNTAVPLPTNPPEQATAVPQPTSPPEQPTTPPQPTEPPPPAPGLVVITNVNKRDEYVDIQNQGGSDVDLSGWVLVSEKGNQACGLGGVIGAGQSLRIWAMSEDTGQGGFNCGFGSNIWNNSDRDPAVLYDATGAEVSRW